LDKALALIKTVLVIVAICAAVFLVLYLGVGSVIRPLLQRAGIWLTPEQTQQGQLAAKLAANTIQPREAAAAIRAAGPANQAAYRKAAAKLT